MPEADVDGARVDDPVRYQVRDAVAYLTIDRPHLRNALDRTTTRQLLERTCQADDDPQVRVLVIRGGGSSAFCAGGDIKERFARDQAGEPMPVPMRGSDRNLFEAVLDVQKPTIAAINGDALGAGAELCLACDLRFAAEHARFGLPEARRGTGANFGSVMLPRLLPRAVALELLFTGELVTAPEALRLGLFNRVVPVDRLDAEVAAVAGRIAANAPLTVRRMKAVTTRGWDLPVPVALRLPASGPDAYNSADRREGTRAFVERRPPRWTGG